MSLFTSWFASQGRNPRKTGRVHPYTVRQTVNHTDYLKPQRWNWSLITKPLDDSIARSAPQPLEREKVVGLRFFLIDGLFATVSDNFYVNYVVLFALAYGASNGQLGLLIAAANLLGAAAFFPGARAVERIGRRKAIVVGAGGVGARLMVLLFALVPVFVKDALPAVLLVIVLNALRAFLGNFANPAWTAMVADLVPPSIRGRYFSSRNTVMGIAALLIGPAAGYVIRHGNGFAGSPLLGYQAVFILACASGLVSAFYFGRIPEPSSPVPVRRTHLRGDLRKALKGSPAFVGFLVSSAVWNIAIQLSAPFFNVYMVQGLGATVDQVGLSIGVASLATLLGQFYYGGVLTRRGNFHVQSVTGLGVPLIPALWMIATQPFHVYFINFFGSFVWAGYNLSNFNLLLELSPEEQRPRAVALYQTVVFTSAVIGPALGGWLADTVGYRVNFAWGTIGRAAGILLFLLLVIRTVRKTGSGTRTAAEPVA